MSGRGANERLRAAMGAADLTYEDLAGVLGVDPKTVQRWVCQGKQPYPRHAVAVARTLGADRFYLWPHLESQRSVREAAPDEVVACHPSRGAVPPGLWREVMSGAAGMLDVVAGCGLSLLDAVPDLIELLAERAAAGVRVRVALPEPDAAGSAVASARAALAEDAFAPLAAVAGVRLAGHGGIANEVIRADDDVLVMPPVDGCTAVSSPVLHLRRLTSLSALSGVYLTGMEHVFATSVPKRHRAPAGMAGVAA